MGHILGRSTLESLLDALALTDDTHTTATSTERSLDDDWVAVFLDKFLSFLELGDGAGGTGDDGDIVLDGEGPGRDLVTEGSNDPWGRANKL